MTLRFEAKDPSYDGNPILYNGFEFWATVSTLNLPPRVDTSKFTYTFDSDPRRGWKISAIITPDEGKITLQNRLPSQGVVYECTIYDFQIKNGLPITLIRDRNYEGIIFPIPDPRPISTSDKV